MIPSALRASFDAVYEDNEIIASMDDAELVEMGQNLRRGVPIATPVFNGAKEADIERLLEQAGLALVGPGRRSMTDAPASPSTARSRSATSTC